MNTFIKRLKLSSAMTLAALLAGAYQPASAQPLSLSSGRTPPELSDSTSPAPVTPGHTLVKTFLRSGEADLTVSADVFTALDKVITINCPKGPCSLSALLVAQAGDNSVSGNYSAVGIAVDGSFVDDCFYTAGSVPTDGTFAIIANTCHLSGLSTGHHTVLNYYFSLDGVFVAYWAATYTLYEP